MAFKESLKKKVREFIFTCSETSRPHVKPGTYVTWKDRDSVTNETRFEPLINLLFYDDLL